MRLLHFLSIVALSAGTTYSQNCPCFYEPIYNPEPVCGVDYVTYDSMCTLACSLGPPELTLLCEGSCYECAGFLGLFGGNKPSMGYQSLEESQRILSEDKDLELSLVGNNYNWFDRYGRHDVIKRNIDDLWRNRNLNGDYSRLGKAYNVVYPYNKLFSGYSRRSGDNGVVSHRAIGKDGRLDRFYRIKKHLGNGQNSKRLNQKKEIRRLNKLANKVVDGKKYKGNKLEKLMRLEHLKNQLLHGKHKGHNMLEQHRRLQPVIHVNGKKHKGHNKLEKLIGLQNFKNELSKKHTGHKELEEFIRQHNLENEIVHGNKHKGHNKLEEHRRFQNLDNELLDNYWIQSKLLDGNKHKGHNKLEKLINLQNMKNKIVDGKKKMGYINSDELWRFQNLEKRHLDSGKRHGDHSHLQKLRWLDNLDNDRRFYI